MFNKKDATYLRGKTTEQIQLMGIESKQFGETAWLRDRLLDHHLNDYLNLIARNPSAVLISKSMAEEYSLKAGDTITLGWDGVEGAQFTVYGVIDYWPSWNPNPGVNDTVTTTTKTGSTTKIKKPKLVIGQLPYIQNNLALEPYEVWLKLKPGASSQTVYQAIVDHGYEIESLRDANQEQIKSIKDPFQMAINGVMTLGFLISVFICFLGSCYIGCYPYSHGRCSLAF